MVVRQGYCVASRTGKAQWYQAVLASPSSFARCKGKLRSTRYVPICGRSGLVCRQSDRNVVAGTCWQDLFICTLDDRCKVQQSDAACYYCRLLRRTRTVIQVCSIGSLQGSGGRGAGLGGGVVMLMAGINLGGPGAVLHAGQITFASSQLHFQRRH